MSKYRFLFKISVFQATGFFAKTEVNKKQKEVFIGIFYCSFFILILSFLVACNIESLHHDACVCPALTGLQHSQGFWNMAANLSIKNFTWTFLWVFYLHFLCTKNALKKFLWTPYTSVLTSNAAQMWIWAKWTSCQITADVPHLN